MQSRVVLNAFAVSLAATLAACSADTGGVTPPAQTVAVEVTPAVAALATGQSVQLAAAVTGTADTAVVWSIDEGGGGTVSGAGLYVAPAAAGTFHVRATAHADPSVSDAATINVTAPPAGSVAISPKATSVAAGGKVTFTATVRNLPSSDVTWSVQETSGCGSVVNGVYTAPSTARTCHVVATSVSDRSKSDVATVTVTAPIQVTLSPASGTVDACRTLTFTASVSGATDQTVTWSVVEGAAGGAITSGGVYTAPSASGTYHVQAVARASSAATRQATVTVQDHVLSVTVTPDVATVGAGSTQQFTATVATTCGSFTATQALAVP